MTLTHRGLARLMPLFGELNDAKRIRVAGRRDSLATRWFRQAWARLIHGEALPKVAAETTARAVAAARLGPIDAAVLAAGGLSAAEVQTVLERSFDAGGAALDEAQTTYLRPALASQSKEASEDGSAFVHLLTQQPRAGATHPTRPRVVLEPAEMHSDHCAVVAVYGVLAAARYDAEPGPVFLAGLAHHLHNAWLPDAGFAGDMLLGDMLPPLMERFREQAIQELPTALHAPVRQALALVFRADTPEARAFQTADVVDRVLEMRWHAQSAAFTLDVALDEMEIVHEGPVQRFQQQVMREVGLVRAE